MEVELNGKFPEEVEVFMYPNPALFTCVACAPQYKYFYDFILMCKKTFLLLKKIFMVSFITVSKY